MNRNASVRRLTLAALLLALSLILSYLEHLLPALPFLPPGVKLGLSNIAVMYALIFLGLPFALPVGVGKALFVLLTRGVVAGLLSLSGALLSVLTMALLKRLHASVLLMSVGGAVTHNLAQLLVVSLWLGTAFFSVYLPLLMLSGIGMGILTGLTLKGLLPAFRRIFPEEEASHET